MHICRTMSANFIVSARKYRPDHWETVVGQRSITTTLQNAIANNQVAQAYLFCGPRGVGKTTCARIFSRAVNGVLNQPEVDLGFNIFELDAASNNSVEDIRQIVDTVRIPPQQGRFKVYIIDEVHMLSSAAFNAFLKTLEEPPAHAIFILATTEKHRIIPTILSRCQVFDFNRIRVKDIADHLAWIAEKEGIVAEPEALHVIAQKADGAMRDALSIFDQVVAFRGRNLTYKEVIDNLNVLDYDYYFRLTDFLLKEEIPNALVLFDEVLNKGFDAHHFVNGLGSHLRNLLVCRDPVTIPLLEVSEAIGERYARQAAEADLMFLVTAIDLVNDCDMNYRGSRHPRLLVELMLMKLASIRYNQSEGEKKKFRLKPFRKGEIEPSSRVPPPPSPASAVEIRKDAPSPLPVRERETAVVSRQIPSAGVSMVSDIPSIKSLKTNVRQKDQVSEKPDKEVLEEPTRAYTSEEIHAAWNEFIDQRLQANRQVQTAFKVAHLELLDDRRLRIAFPSPTQHIYFNDERGALIDFFRSAHGITGLIYVLDIQRSEEVRLSTKTDKEKFDAMREKNPAMDLLWRTFQLRVD